MKISTVLVSLAAVGYTAAIPLDSNTGLAIRQSQPPNQNQDIPSKNGKDGKDGKQEMSDDDVDEFSFDDPRAPIDGAQRSTKTVTVDFEDRKVILNTVLNNIKKPYHEMNWKGGYVYRKRWYHLLAAVRPASGKNYWLSTWRKRLTKGNPTMSVQGTGYKSFDLHSAAIGCYQYTGLLTLGSRLAVNCKVRVDGIQADGTDVTAEVEWKRGWPFMSKMKNKDFEDKLKNLESATFTVIEAPGVDKWVGLGIDDVKYTINA